MNQRILIVDDTKSIHEDFRKILRIQSQGAESSTFEKARAAFFGGASEVDAEEAPESSEPTKYEITSAFQGQSALELVKESLDNKTPYAVAFVDVRMPPGWDGIQTIKEIWAVDPSLHCVICTAYSDYSWDDIAASLGQTDQLLILKKPFDPAEIRQVASAFTAKWNAAASEREAIEAVRHKETEARSYARSLETLNKALATSKASADRLSVMKSDFMLRLTEEVRDQIQGILEKLTSEGRTEGLEDALERGEKLLSTMDKVVDFTSVETGKMVVRPSAFNVREIFRDLEEEFGNAAEAKGLILQSRITDSVPSQVRSDRERIQQVLGHLVDNAVRYTEKGRVFISAATEPTESWDQVRLRFDVTDTGRGITQERRTRIFEPFCAEEENEDCSGSGLGLTVAKQIARLLGGDLQLNSLPGEGCTFTLRLQVRRVEAKASGC